MSFAQRAATAIDRSICPVGRVLAALDDLERAQLNGMLAAPTTLWPHVGENSIQEAIEEEGHGRVSDRTIRLHRAGTCLCTKNRPKR